MGAAAARLPELTDNLPALIDDQMDELLQRVQESVISIDLEPFRTDFQQLISENMEFAFEAVSRERIAAMEAVSKEREIIMKEVQEIMDNVMENSLDRVEAQIDVQLARLVPLGLAVMTGPFALGVVVGLIFKRRATP